MMDKKTSLNNELSKNRLQINHIYKTLWVLQAVAVLMSSDEAILLIFIAFLPHFHQIAKMRKENDLIAASQTKRKG